MASYAPVEAEAVAAAEEIDELDPFLPEVPEAGCPGQATDADEPLTLGSFSLMKRRRKKELI